MNIQSAKTGEMDEIVEYESLEMAKVALELALDKKALEPVLLDVEEECSYTNHILIVSARSDRQADAIAMGISQEMKAKGIYPLGSEGRQSSHWKLLDFGDFIVHVFYHPVRSHYDLEGLFPESTAVEIEVPPEARVPIEESY